MANNRDSYEYSVRKFLLSVGLILAVAALAKYISITGNAKILDLDDPLLMAKNRHVMLLAALAETAICVFLFWGRSVRSKLMWVAWLGSTFLVYRIGLLVLHPTNPCPCLGVLTQRLPISPPLLRLMLLSAVVYMITGSVYFLMRCRFAVNIGTAGEIGGPSSERPD